MPSGALEADGTGVKAKVVAVRLIAPTGGGRHRADEKSQAAKGEG
jgi:hypothetical protein